MTYKELREKHMILDFIKEYPKMFFDYIEQVGIISTDAPECITETLDDYVNNYLLDGEFADWCEKNAGYYPDDV